MNRHTVLVLGGSGLIGNEIVRRLQQEKADITVVDLRKLPQQDGVRLIQADIFLKDSLRQILDEVKPDTIINCVNIATICSHNPKKGYQQIVGFYVNLYRGMVALPHPLHYLQMGTTGSGGLGFNIPFTHGDKLDDLPIINKSAFSGITTSMLTLLSRSFGNDVKVSEVKPGLAIFGEEVVHHTYRGSQVVMIDGGESGYYTYNELALLTAYMGFTTVSRLVDKALGVLGDTGTKKVFSEYDVIENINATIIKSNELDTYYRTSIQDSMRAFSGHDYIVAIGKLGPPSITRDLILAFAIVNHLDVSARNFLDSLAKNVSLRNTLGYIQEHDRGLYAYLQKQCTHEAYQELSRYPHAEGTEPWELVKTKLDS